MGCPSCGAENPSGARFCNSCGAPQAAICPGCGNGNPPGSRFCNACATPLAAPAPTRPEASPSPHSYTPRHLAEKILASRDALQGERKQVTILFADVVGSTELIRDRDPEEAQRLLDGAVQVMMDAVHRYEGTVSRLQGDGLLALFGAPIAHEDHALRACFAALAMLDGARAYAEEARQASGALIQVRVGLDSGDVIVRLISDDLHMDYTAMGPTVHLASRMEQLAAPGTVMLSRATRALVEGFVELRPLGPRSVKGFDQPVEVFELMGVGAARTRLQATSARGLTPFVGRDAERAAIERALEQARAGRGQVVALVAEAGVGKSRLVWEATRSERADATRVLQTGAVSYGQATTWLPVIELLRGYFHIESRDDHATMREKVTAGLHALGPSLEPGLPALLALLDVPLADAADAAWAQRDPAQRRHATLDAVQQLLLREGQRQPLLLVFEDLHWIDSETQALLDALVEALPTARILLLVNYRPEYTHAWGSKRYYTQLRVDPLVAASAQELLGTLLGPDPTTLPLSSLLVQRTEGTPLFLEESVRALVETGALVGERGAYHLTHPVEEIRVPPTVQAVLAARIDRLPASEKRLLQTASVVGKDVPFRLLQAVAETPAAELQVSLARLQTADLLYPLARFPDLEHTFKHALTHEVAYGSLLQDRRRRLHARIVSAIEAEYGDRLDEQVERLAYHAIRGEVWERALTYSQQAASRAGRRSAYSEAMVALTQALAAAEHLADRQAAGLVAVDLHLSLANVAQSMGNTDLNLHHLQEAERKSLQLGDRRRLGLATALISQSEWVRGDQDRAIRLGTVALTMADELDDFELRTAATYLLGAYYHTVGRFSESGELLRRVILWLADMPDWRPPWSTGGAIYPVVSRNYLTWGLAEHGIFAAGRVHAMESVQIAEQHGSAYNRAAAAHALGVLNLLQGEVADAVDGLVSALERCRSAGVRFWVVRLEAALGLAYSRAGRHDLGIPLLQRSIDQSERTRNFVFQAFRVVGLGEALLLAGRPVEAQAAASLAVELARLYRERAQEAWALRLLGEIAMRREPADFMEGEARFHAALAVADELEMRPLQAHCHLGLGKLYRRTGRPDEARAELATAVTMLREMGMAFWLPEAERELAEAERHIEA
jgi:class 3 adenylate cyclase/tetratricopeptide (TPR) repeat protein